MKEKKIRSCGCGQRAAASHHQHGDVILKPGVAIPAGAKSVKLAGVSRFVVERGEGVHTHDLVTELGEALSDLCEVYEQGGEMYIRVKAGKRVTLDHVEHGKQTLLPGTYKKVIEREYDYEQNEERRVID